MPVGGEGLQVVDGSQAVVPPGHHLEQVPSQRGRGAGVPRREHGLERLRAVDERLDVRGAFGTARLFGECLDVLGGLAVGLRPDLLQEGLVEGPVVHLLGQVVDAGPPLSCLGDDPVEEGSPGRVVVVLDGMIEPPLEEGEHGPDLLIHPPLRPGDAVQGLLELERGFEALDPVVSQRAPQLIDEGLGEPASDAAKVAQVGEQVLRCRAPPEVGVVVGRQRDGTERRRRRTR